MPSPITARTHSNSYQSWVGMGKPSKPSQAQWRSLSSAAELCYFATTATGASWTVTYPHLRGQPHHPDPVVSKLSGVCPGAQRGAGGALAARLFRRRGAGRMRRNGVGWSGQEHLRPWPCAGRKRGVCREGARRTARQPLGRTNDREWCQHGIRRYLAMARHPSWPDGPRPSSTQSPRYVKLQATSATGNNVKINEVDVGCRLVSPIAN